MYFETATPESVGIRSADIRTFLEESFKAGIQLHSFMLVRHGKVAAQGWVRPYSADARHIIYSFSKTFTATAIGFAMQEGILTLDEKLVDLFPEELPDTISENLALADIESLLTMSCGHETEITKSDIQANDGNWVKAFLAHEFVFRPHTMFQYNTFGTDLLSLILEKKSGQKLTQFLTPRLFDPLGIKDVYCSTMGDRAVAPDAPYSQVEGGGWGYHMRTEDLARFIWFLEQRGVWEGKRLLNEDWFDRAFTRQIETMNGVYDASRPNWQKGYCYQCWCNTIPGTWRADGLYGQFGYVLPKQDAIMIMTAASVDTEGQLSLFAENIAKRMAEEPLPEDPAEYEALQETIRGLRIPGLWNIRQIWSEQVLGGKTYCIDNPYGISFEEFIGGEGHFGHDSLVLRNLSISFDQNQLLIRLSETDGEKESVQILPVGLDGEYRECTLSDGTYYSSGKWVWSDEMELEVRFQEALGAAMIRLTFDDANLKLSVRSQIPEELDLTVREVRMLCGTCQNQ